MSVEDEDRVRLLRIITQLTRGTKGGQVEWSVGAGDSFAAQFVAGSIVITAVDQDGRAPYYVEALDENGRTIASAATLRSPAILPGTSEDQWNQALVELYRVGRAAALNIDEKLDRLLNDVMSANQPSDDDIPF